MSKVEENSTTSGHIRRRTGQHGFPALAEFVDETLPASSLAIIGLFVLAVFYTLYWGRAFFIPVALAFFLSFLLGPAVRALAKLRIPQALGAALVLVAVLLAVVFVAMRVGQPAAQWLQQAPKDWQAFEQKARRVIRPVAQLNDAARKAGEMADGTEPNTPKVEVRSSNNLMTSALGWTKEFITQTVAMVILLYFLLASDLFTSKLSQAFPGRKEKNRAVAIAHEIGETISSYLFIVAIINCCLGVYVGLATFFIGMPNPLLWGIMAALLNFIPYFGPLVGVGVLAVTGLVQFDSWTYGFLPAACYLGLHGIEANLITPTVLGHRLTVNPVFVFIALMFWAWLWGIVGAFLAVPILMACKCVCDHVEKLSPLGKLLDP